MRLLAGLLTIAALACCPPVEARTARALDLAFVLDTTGSMSAEIREAKERVHQVAAALAAARPGVRVRLAVVAYRDRGDEYLTRHSPLTEDLGLVDTFLSTLRAGGGGDSPEDLLSGLAVALSELAWDESAETDRQVFLIGDAPPQLGYEDGARPDEIVAEALERRIVVNAIGCRSLSSEGVAFFRSLAYSTEGAYHHVGRVELGGRKASTPGLADAVVATLGKNPERTGPTRPLALHRSSAPPPEIGRHLQVERMPGEDACLLGVVLPQGLRLADEPSVSESDEGLEVLLTLAAGQGESQAFELSPCPDEALPVRLALLNHSRPQD